MQKWWSKLPMVGKWAIGISGAIVLLVIGSAIGSSGVDSEVSDLEATLSSAKGELRAVEASVVKLEGQRDAALEDAAAARQETIELEDASAESDGGSESEAEPVAEGEAEPTEPPNVVGLPLPQAKQMLEEAGYRTAAKNTDTTFGIIVPENYTICNQGKPRGDLVVVLAQKYGC